jgi:hypothetical protein
MRPLPLTALAFGIFAGTLSAQTVRSDGKILFKTCGGTSTLITDKNVCYVVDTESGDKKWVIDVCTGVNVSGGTIVLGGRVSTMLCATVEIAGAKSKQDAIKHAEKWLNEHLTDTKTCADLAKKIADGGSVNKAQPFKLREDKDTAEKLKELRDSAK